MLFTNTCLGYSSIWKNKQQTVEGVIGRLTKGSRALSGEWGQPAAWPGAKRTRSRHPLRASPDFDWTDTSSFGPRGWPDAARELEALLYFLTSASCSSPPGRRAIDGTVTEIASRRRSRHDTREESRIDDDDEQSIAWLPSPARGGVWPSLKAGNKPGRLLFPSPAHLLLVPPSHPTSRSEGRVVVRLAIPRSPPGPPPAVTVTDPGASLLHAPFMRLSLENVSDGSCLISHILHPHSPPSFPSPDGTPLCGYPAS